MATAAWTIRCALRTDWPLVGTNSAGSASGSDAAVASRSIPFAGSVPVIGALAMPLAPVRDRSGSPSAPVAFRLTSTFGTRRPLDVSTSTVSSAAWPATSLSGSVALTLYGPA